MGFAKQSLPQAIGTALARDSAAAIMFFFHGQMSPRAAPFLQGKCFLQASEQPTLSNQGEKYVCW